MESTGDNPIDNIHRMDRALESEWLEDVQEVQGAQVQESQEVEGLDRQEGRRITIMGQDPLYHLIWQMGLTPAQVEEYYVHMHQEMARC